MPNNTTLSVRDSAPLCDFVACYGLHTDLYFQSTGKGEEDPLTKRTLEGKLTACVPLNNEIRNYLRDNHALSNRRRTSSSDSIDTLPDNLEMSNDFAYESEDEENDNVNENTFTKKTEDSSILPVSANLNRYENSDNSTVSKVNLDGIASVPSTEAVVSSVSTEISSISSSSSIPAADKVQKVHNNPSIITATTGTTPITIENSSTALPSRKRRRRKEPSMEFPLYPFRCLPFVFRNGIQLCYGDSPSTILASPSTNTNVSIDTPSSSSSVLCKEIDFVKGFPLQPHNPSSYPYVYTSTLRTFILTYNDEKARGLYGHVLTRWHRITCPRKIAIMRMQIAAHTLLTHKKAMETYEHNNNSSKHHHNPVPDITPEILAPATNAWEPSAILIVTTEPCIETMRGVLLSFDSHLAPQTKFSAIHAAVLYRTLGGRIRIPVSKSFSLPYSTRNISDTNNNDDVQLIYIPSGVGLAPYETTSDAFVSLSTMNEGLVCIQLPWYITNPTDISSSSYPNYSYLIMPPSNALTWEIPQLPWTCTECHLSCTGITRKELQNYQDNNNYDKDHPVKESSVNLRTYLRCIETGTCNACIYGNTKDESHHQSIDNLLPYVPLYSSLSLPTSSSSSSPSASVPSSSSSPPIIPLPFVPPHIVKQQLSQSNNTISSFTALPTLDIDPRPLFALVQPKHIIAIVTALLCERNVLVVSSDTSILPDIMSTLLSLLHPLIWCGAFIPLLPAGYALTDALSAPLPVFVGASPDDVRDTSPIYFSGYDPSEDYPRSDQRIRKDTRRFDRGNSSGGIHFTSGERSSYNPILRKIPKVFSPWSSMVPLRWRLIHPTFWYQYAHILGPNTMRSIQNQIIVMQQQPHYPNRNRKIILDPQYNHNTMVRTSTERRSSGTATISHGNNDHLHNEEEEEDLVDDYTDSGEDADNQMLQYNAGMFINSKVITNLASATTTGTYIVNQTYGTDHRRRSDQLIVPSSSSITATASPSENPTVSMPIYQWGTLPRLQAVTSDGTDVLQQQRFALPGTSSNGSSSSSSASASEYTSGNPDDASSLNSLTSVTKFLLQSTWELSLGLGLPLPAKEAGDYLENSGTENGVASNGEKKGSKSSPVSTTKKKKNGKKSSSQSTKQNPMFASHDKAGQCSIVILDIDADSISPYYLPPTHLLPTRIVMRLWKAILTYANLWVYNRQGCPVPPPLPDFPIGTPPSEIGAALGAWEEFAERAVNKGWCTSKQMIQGQEYFRKQNNNNDNATVTVSDSSDEDNNDDENNYNEGSGTTKHQQDGNSHGRIKTKSALQKYLRKYNKQCQCEPIGPVAVPSSYLRTIMQHNYEQAVNATDNDPTLRKDTIPEGSTTSRSVKNNVPSIPLTHFSVDTLFRPSIGPKFERLPLHQGNHTKLVYPYPGPVMDPSRSSPSMTPVTTVTTTVQSSENSNVTTDKNSSTTVTTNTSNSFATNLFQGLFGWTSSSSSSAASTATGSPSTATASVTTTNANNTPPIPPASSTSNNPTTSAATTKPKPSRKKKASKTSNHSISYVNELGDDNLPAPVLRRSQLHASLRAIDFLHSDDDEEDDEAEYMNLPSTGTHRSSTDTNNTVDPFDYAPLALIPPWAQWRTHLQHSSFYRETNVEINSIRNASNPSPMWTKILRIARTRKTNGNTGTAGSGSIDYSVLAVIPEPPLHFTQVRLAFMNALVSLLKAYRLYVKGVTYVGVPVPLENTLSPNIVSEIMVNNPISTVQTVIPDPNTHNSSGSSNSKDTNEGMVPNTVNRTDNASLSPGSVNSPYTLSYDNNLPSSHTIIPTDDARTSVSSLDVSVDSLVLDVVPPPTIVSSIFNEHLGSEFTSSSSVQTTDNNDGVILSSNPVVHSSNTLSTDELMSNVQQKLDELYQNQQQQPPAPLSPSSSPLNILPSMVDTHSNIHLTEEELLVTTVTKVDHKDIVDMVSAPFARSLNVVTSPPQAYINPPLLTGNKVIRNTVNNTTTTPYARGNSDYGLSPSSSSSAVPRERGTSNGSTSSYHSNQTPRDRLNSNFSITADPHTVQQHHRSSPTLREGSSASLILLDRNGTGYTVDDTDKTTVNPSTNDQQDNELLVPISSPSLSPPLPVAVKFDRSSFLASETGNDGFCEAILWHLVFATQSFQIFLQERIVNTMGYRLAAAKLLETKKVPVPIPMPDKDTKNPLSKIVSSTPPVIPPEILQELNDDDQLAFTSIAPPIDMGPDLFDRSCFRRMFSRSWRHSQLRDRPFTSFLHKAMRGTLSKSWTFRLFELRKNVLAYYANGELIEKLEKKLLTLRTQINSVRSTDEINSMNTKIEKETATVATLRHQSYRGTFFLVPGRTQIHIPSSSYQFTATGNGGSNGTMNDYNIKGNFLSNLVYRSTTNTNGNNTVTNFPTRFIFQLINPPIQHGLVGISEGHSSDHILLNSGTTTKPLGTVDETTATFASPGLDILTLCAESSSARREWILRLRAQLRASVGGTIELSSPTNTHEPISSGSSVVDRTLQILYLGDTGGETMNATDDVGMNTVDDMVGGDNDNNRDLTMPNIYYTDETVNNKESSTVPDNSTIEITSVTGTETEPPAEKTMITNLEETIHNSSNNNSSTETVNTLTTKDEEKIILSDIPTLSAVIDHSSSLSSSSSLSTVSCIRQRGNTESISIGITSSLYSTPKMDRQTSVPSNIREMGEHAESFRDSTSSSSSSSHSTVTPSTVQKPYSPMFLSHRSASSVHLVINPTLARGGVSTDPAAEYRAAIVRAVRSHQEEKQHGKG